MLQRKAVSKRRKAVGFLFFVLIMFPVLVAALGISADFTRLIIGHRQVSDTADSVALAAAHAFDSNSGGLSASPSLNAAQARAYAQETFDQAVGNSTLGSMLNAVENPQLGDVKISDSNTRVTITITYKMTGFIAVDYLAGKHNNLTFTVVRDAQICSSTNLQYCGYPVS